LRSCCRIDAPRSRWSTARGCRRLITVNGRSGLVSGTITSSGPERIWSPVVDQHATWIAVNPIQGCPAACAYCFLHERRQAAVRPEIVASPVETVELLLKSQYYEKERSRDLLVTP
jgi:tRNA A37 methylthiotransferase MiaB